MNVNVFASSSQLGAVCVSSLPVTLSPDCALSIKHTPTSFYPTCMTTFTILSSIKICISHIMGSSRICCKQI